MIFLYFGLARRVRKVGCTSESRPRRPSQCIGATPVVSRKAVIGFARVSTDHNVAGFARCFAVNQVTRLESVYVKFDH